MWDCFCSLTSRRIPEEEIEEKLKVYREELKNGALEEEDKQKLNESHRISLAKEKEMERVKQAFGISADYQTGDAFHFEEEEGEVQENQDAPKTLDEKPKMKSSYLDRGGMNWTNKKTNEDDRRSRRKRSRRYDDYDRDYDRDRRRDRDRDRRDRDRDRDYDRRRRSSKWDRRDDSDDDYDRRRRRRRRSRTRSPDRRHRREEDGSASRKEDSAESVKSEDSS